MCIIRLFGQTLIVLVAVVSAGCAAHAGGGVRSVSRQSRSFDGSRLDKTVPALLREHHVAGAGVAVIHRGKLVWTGYYGEQAPGVPVSAHTLFNTASVAKTVTAETMIALADKGLISLDEPIYRYVDNSDLKSDPRYQMLTPRLLLSHRGGLLNWPYSYKDGKLAFVADPGTGVSYSGAGVDMAAMYAQNKLGKDFDALASERIFRPLGISKVTMRRYSPRLKSLLAAPMDYGGKYLDSKEPPYGPPEADVRQQWSAADDLMIGVEDYAAFLISVMNRKDTQGRATIRGNLVGDPIWNCIPAPDVVCAKAYGYGIGWMVYEYPNKTILKHGGNDEGENALVYFSPETRDGAVIFVDGGNGIFVTTRIVELIGDEPEIAGYYRQLIERHYKVPFPALTH